MNLEEKRERIKSLENTIANFTRNRLASDPRCLAAMEELDRLKSGGLEFAKSLAAIRAAAAKGEYIAYGEVAAASKVPWNEARRQINRHLDDLCRWAHAKGFPLITSIVVERENLKTGELGEAALAGFLKSAVNCGVVVGAKEREFLKDQQQRTFDWAAAGESA